MEVVTTGSSQENGFKQESMIFFRAIFPYFGKLHRINPEFLSIYILILTKGQRKKWEL